MADHGGLAWSDEELEVARSLLADGHPRQAISRSYYAAFYAADAALRELGEARSKHSGLIAAFSRRLVKEEGIDPAVGAALRRLFEARGKADYIAEPARKQDARAAIEDAEAFVAAVRAWLAPR